ncbi:hypothetical protein ACIOWI_29695 [Streptomyces sp. NPDC087659]|uniref:hypothetical protein n=1 Tax=Streptomyces sp. NPDC087659 TaxID=3365801 RepID=UPI0037FB0874
MDMGDAPGWVALAFAAAALYVSWKARRDGRRSADASERSAKAAEDSVAESRRSADAAEAALADQRHEAERRRLAEEEAARPRAHLVLGHVTKDLFRLQNDGTGAALGIRFDDTDLPYVFKLRGTGDVSLNAGEAIDFLMAGDLPPQVFARWDGQDEWVPLRVPPKH